MIVRDPTAGGLTIEQTIAGRIERDHLARLVQYGRERARSAKGDRIVISRRGTERENIVGAVAEGIVAQRYGIPLPEDFGVHRGAPFDFLIRGQRVDVKGT